MDRRELILARLLAIAVDIVGVDRAVRNTNEITGKTAPAIVINDGDEHVHEDSNAPRNALGNPAVMREFVQMEPSIQFLVGLPMKDVGTTINQYRAQIVPTIVQDSQLASAVSGDGEIRYTGCTMETQHGEKREGRMLLHFMFIYPLSVTELMGP
jgi:hypothetical protein